MSDHQPAVRASLLTLVIGLTIVASLWTCVRIAARISGQGSGNSITSPESGPESISSSGHPIAPRPQVADAAGKAAGQMVLFFGILGTVAAAVVIGVQTLRRIRELDLLSDRIRWMADFTTDELISFPPDRSPAMDLLARRMTDSHQAIRTKIQQLSTERQRGFHVLGHMTDGVVAVSFDRRVLLLNRAAHHLLGIVRHKLVGRKLAEVIRVPQIVTAVDSVLAGKGPQEVELEFASGSNRCLRVQAIELPGDGAAGVLVTIRDETQVKNLEKLRREFIANVSHELKTPLAAVKGYAETLQLGAKDDPETCTHFLEQIDFQANRLERLINDMLQLARAQTGIENLRLTSVSLSTVIEESLRAYTPLAQARQQSLNWQQSERPIFVTADREALLTIVNNLVGNALRYTAEGGTINVSVRPAGTHWAFVVNDNGMGIPQEDQHRIFERFYRVEKARDSTQGGTGLGLSIVKNLVQALGGEIRLKSKVGFGSTFEVLLPMATTNEHGVLAADIAN